MNAYAWSSLITLLSVLSIGIGVLLHHPEGKVNRQFALFASSIAIWAGGRVLYLTTPDYETALFWVRFAVAGVIFIPTFFLHFVYAFLQIRRDRSLFLSYAASLILIAINFTPWMIQGVSVKYQSSFFADAGPLYSLLLVLFTIDLFIGFNLLRRRYRLTSGPERSQICLLFWSTLLGFGGGTTNFLTDLGLEIYSLSAYATYLVPVYAALLMYAIVRHHLLDVQIVLQNSMVYFVTFLITAIPFFLLTAFFQTVLPLKAANITTFILFISILLVFSNIKPLTQQWVERSIFRERYRHYQSIHDFSESMVKLLHLEDLTERLFSILSETLRPQSISFFLPDGKGNFQFHGVRNSEDPAAPNHIFSSQHPLVRELQRQKRMLVCEEMEWTGNPSEALEEMRKLGCSLSLPFIFDDHLIGICHLGPKQNGKSYSPAERFMLQTLCANASVAFENARLFREVNRHAEEKIESIGVLAGGIAHDFNNILTVIMGNISLSKMQIDPANETFTLLSQAEKASLRAKDLTQHLLTFSKGGAPLKKITSITPLLMNRTGSALEGTNTRCEFSLPENLWSVEVDEGQISQVIDHLVVNAKQAMPEGGGIVRICGENVTITQGRSIHGLSLLKEERYVKITVEDEGAGIPEENLHKIFDPYFTTKTGGNGLGLATVYSIVKKHEGFIEVKSKVATGTTFHVYLPASRKKLSSPEEIQVSPRRHQGRILLMDDEETLRYATGKLLVHFGFEVEFAKDGTEALTLYQKFQKIGQPFDAVIMDLTIPSGMGGKEAIQKLLELAPQAKVIVSSGYSNDPVMADFRKYGFKGVVAKPYRIEELIETLHKLTIRADE